MLDKAQRGTAPAGRELRTYPAQFEIRSLSGTMVELTGYATTYDEPYEMFDMFGPYTEVARSGMCAKTLAEDCDTAFLANHEGLTMARTKAGTLRLSEDSKGLPISATLNTARSDVRDLVLAVEDENVDQMSFAFRVVRQSWSPDWEQRDLVEVNLNKGDVSAVNYGANPNTTIGLARAFHHRRAANLHRIAVELRAGKTLSQSTMDTLSQVLELVASADDAVDQAQPLLADLMGVPNPDADDSEPDADDSARGLAHLETLRRRNEHEAERLRLIVDF